MMQFGSTVGKACLTFVITNIDDAFVLVTFFAESATSPNLTPLKITLGQYLGFTVIVAISMIGFAVAVALPSEPIGFLGLLPILLGVWKFLDLVSPKKDANQEAEEESKQIANAKSVLKVASVTIMNGGDNIGTYVPLFSQAKGAEIAVYVVVYYILLGIWCLVAFLIMKQKHILRVCEKYASYVIPFLYIGLGIYIVVKSDCFPWTIDEIDDQLPGNPGQTVMGVVTAGLMSLIITVMIWFKVWRPYRRSKVAEDVDLNDTAPDGARREGNELDTGNFADSKDVSHIAIEPTQDSLERPGTECKKAASDSEKPRSNDHTKDQEIGEDGHVYAAAEDPQRSTGSSRELSAEGR